MPEVSPYDCINLASLRDALLYVTPADLPERDGYGFLRVGAAIRAAHVDGGRDLWSQWLSVHLPDNEVDVPTVWEWLGSEQAYDALGAIGPAYVIDKALDAGWDGANTPFSTLPPLELPEADERPDEPSSVAGLPHAVSLAAVWDAPPSRPPVLIGTEERGLLRRGHTAVLAGPTKVGKTWCMTELCVDVATGTPWLGFPCAKGRVVYVNLEVDGRSCIRRVMDVTRAVDPSDEFGRTVAANMHVLNWRGTVATTDQYADAIIAEALAIGDVSLVVVDPLGIYSDADENSNGEMRGVMASLNRIATETGASVLTAHHYAKGKAGGKLAIDRFSGAGMIARCPDAVIDMVPLEPPDEETAADLGDATAWRVTATLREFRAVEPFGVLFSWPRHIPTSRFDSWEVQGADPFAEGRKAKRKREEDTRQARADLLRAAFMACVAEGAVVEVGGVEGVTVSELHARCGEDPKTGKQPGRRAVSDWLDEEWSPVCKVDVSEPGSARPRYLCTLGGDDL